MSSRVAVSACPMCSDPVTLGGGRMMQYGGLLDGASARKHPERSQRRYQRASTSAGS